MGPEQAFAEFKETLTRDHSEKRSPMELGFFGGTFTSLPPEWIDRFLGLAVEYRERGLITSIRCSTRPDAVSPALLSRLKQQGLDMVELGIQTFHDPTLLASKRGYAPHTATEACKTVREAGLELGIQLLPGLPEHTPGHLAEDIKATVDQTPSVVRLYPCVVLKGTQLAVDFNAGHYAPWGLDETVEALGSALYDLWSHDIPVIRIGLAPEQDIQDHILAGPWHPALGQLARSLALFKHIRDRAEGLPQPPTRLTVPMRYQSDILGHKHSMRERYRAMGIDTVSFHDKVEFILE